MKKNNAGMTLLELIIGVIAALILLMAIGIRTRGVIQRAKISASKAAINTLALALSTVRADTGFYPIILEDLKSTTSPPYLNIPARFWKGPYLTQGVSLIDPWGEPYFYEIVQGAVFGPSFYERTTGGPFHITDTFPAIPGNGRIIIINEDNPVTSGEVLINGAQIVSPDDFKTITPRIEKNINLQEENTIEIKLGGQPGRSIILSITSAYSKDTTFILGSYGKDNEPGGEGFDTDIVHGAFR